MSWLSRLGTVLVGLLLTCGRCNAWIGQNKLYTSFLFITMDPHDWRTTRFGMVVSTSTRLLVAQGLGTRTSWMGLESA